MTFLDLEVLLKDNNEVNSPNPNSLILFLGAALFAIGCSKKEEDVEWRSYLGDQASSQYSALNQITKENVHQLKSPGPSEKSDVRHPIAINWNAIP